MDEVLNPASGPGGGEQPVVLASFPAGKMERDGSTVTADPRRGFFQIAVTQEDMLTHLQWRAKGVAMPEIDLIIFPGEAEFAPVSSSPDRVFVLKWREGSERKFFWMQGRDPDQDHTVVESVNQILSDGPTAAQPAMPPSLVTEGPSSAPPPDAEVAEVHQSLMPPASRAGDGQEAVPLTQGSTSNPGVTLAGLQEAMAGATATLAQATPTLGEVLHPDVMGDVLNSTEMVAELPKLAEYLPGGERSDVESILNVLRSPALRAQAASLTNALASGGAADLIASFGLPGGDPGATTAVGAAGLNAFFASLRRVPRKKN